MLKSKLDSLDTVLAQEKRRLNSYQEQLSNKQSLIAHLQKSIKLCELCLQEQVSIFEHIEEIENEFLRVFDDDLQFKFETAFKTDKVTVSGYNPSISNAGNGNRPSEGQRTVGSLGLRTQFLKLKPISQVLILDEYLADVAPALTQQLIELLTELGVQVVLATHQNVAFSTTYEVTKRNKISEVKRI